MIKTELLLKKKTKEYFSIESLIPVKKIRVILQVIRLLWKKKINTKNVPIGIPTIQKSVSKSAGTTFTKNNMTGGNEKEKLSSSGMISTTDKKSFISNRKSNIGPGTVPIGNIPNFDDTPVEQKKRK